MIFELNDTTKAEPLFAGWEETLIYSCIQKVMGKIYVTDVDNPKSACAFVGCFAFYAGEPIEELVKEKPDGFVIMTPQNDEWARLIEKCFPSAKTSSPVSGTAFPAPPAGFTTRSQDLHAVSFPVSKARSAFIPRPAS